MMSIPASDPGARFANYKSGIVEAIQSVVSSGRYILGPQVEAFEVEFAAFLDTARCVGVASGTDAITLALQALGIGVGDEVIAPALTAHGTATGICRTGATPVFVDVERGTRCLDPKAVEAAIGPRTAAIVAVHLYGRPAPMQELAAVARTHHLALVEDAAQAHGARIGDRRIGTYGDAAAFSFYPTKNLGAIGDGGAVVTNDNRVADRIVRARNYGWDAERVSRESGLNSRLDEIQAAVLRLLLPDLDNYNRRRIALAQRYREALSDLPLMLPDHPAGTVFHQFVVEVEQRKDFRKWMADGGIGTDVHYPLGLHRMPAFPDADLPVTDILTEMIVSLPIQPEIAEPHFDRIVDRIRNWTWK
jgi:dTDP-3-amino-3,4,6-trideoxy-alpha-D-glucose transaminase